MRAGRLLPDLYWLLSPLTLEVPPLRERKGDLPRLVGDMLAARDRTAHCLTPAAWEVLRGHDWPGNLTELRRALATATTHASGERIDITDLPAYLRLTGRLDGQRCPEPALPLERLLEQAERRIIELALRRARGNRTRAAELLGVHRARLLRRLEVLGVEPGEARLLPATDEPVE
jgi:DNA-binding NtrC family response regulator